MHLLLSPNDEKQLASIYDRAFKEATKLYIASAYLTSWDAARKLNRQCRQLTFVVGTDFGITRKAAMRDVLRWLPKGTPTIFGAASLPDGGFHPKVMAWIDGRGRKFCLMGSSNLSKAAFGANCEANVLLPLSDDQFGEIAAWLEGIAESAEPITGDWIDFHYREAKAPRRGGTKRPSGSSPPGIVSIRFSGVPGLRDVVKERRRKQKAFAEISKPLLSVVKASARGSLDDDKFWNRFWTLWAHHESRIQGSGLQMTCKHAKWQEANASLTRILEASESTLLAQLDHLVVQEIDGLVEARNPAYGAWLSEMLCHFLPANYPVMNSPVRAWFKNVKWRPRRGLTKGQRYVEQARQLRYVLRHKPHGARDLVELDGLIWKYAKGKGLLENRGSTAGA